MSVSCLATKVVPLANCTDFPTFFYFPILMPVDRWAVLMCAWRIGACMTEAWEDCLQVSHSGAEWTDPINRPISIYKANYSIVSERLSL